MRGPHGLSIVQFGPACETIRVLLMFPPTTDRISCSTPGVSLIGPAGDPVVAREVVLPRQVHRERSRQATGDEPVPEYEFAAVEVELDTTNLRPPSRADSSATRCANASTVGFEIQ